MPKGNADQISGSNLTANQYSKNICDLAILALRFENKYVAKSFLEHENKLCNMDNFANWIFKEFHFSGFCCS